MGLGRGLGAGALWDNPSSYPDGLEEKTNSLLQMNSDLHYGMADESHLDQDIDNSLLGATSLLPVMDQAQLFPSPPTLDGTIHIIDAGECRR